MQGIRPVIATGRFLEEERLTTGALDFTIVASYENSAGQRVYTLNVNGVLIEAVQIATGQNHSCALLSNNSVKCWGYNNTGQLGDGTTTNRNAPVTVVGLPDSAIQSIALGHDTSCVVTAAAEAWCWGKNDFGQLGRGTTSSIGREVPAKATHIGAPVISMSVGGHHACAILSSGAARCWGSNTSGRLGTGDTINRLSPAAVAGLPSALAQIHAQSGHTCAQTVSGQALCWGNNGGRQLGGRYRYGPTAAHRGVGNELWRRQVVGRWARQPYLCNYNKRRLLLGEQYLWPAWQWNHQSNSGARQSTTLRHVNQKQCGRALKARPLFWLNKPPC